MRRGFRRFFGRTKRDRTAEGEDSDDNHHFGGSEDIHSHSASPAPEKKMLMKPRIQEPVVIDAKPAGPRHESPSDSIIQSKQPRTWKERTIVEEAKYPSTNGDGFLKRTEEPRSALHDSFLTERSPGGRKPSMSNSSTQGHILFDDAPNVVKSYDAIPILEQTKLPRGGVSMETQSVGRVQFGIPPETIKDSMRLGLLVPSVYIVPVERFCREMGPALGVNLAEFEFPGYFNFFVCKRRCTLVVDSEDAEKNIRRVFSETLLGPGQFRREENPLAYEEEDFAPDFPRDAIPNFSKELKHFRILDGKELVLETLLNFRHFEMPGESGMHENLGVPPPVDDNDGALPKCGDEELVDHIDEAEFEEEQQEMPKDLQGVENTQKTPWTYSQARWIGDVATVWPPHATEEQIKNRSCGRVEIFKMPGGTEYILHDIDADNHIVGKARFAGHVKVSESMSVDGFGGKSILDDHGSGSLIKRGETKVSVEEDDEDDDADADSESSDAINFYLSKTVLPPTFHPPSFGVTVLGNSHGFDKSGSVSGYVLWINGRGVMIDPPPYSSATLEREGIRPRTIVGIIITHCHADHDAGAFQKVLTGSPVVVITTPTIYKSFIRKYAALSALSPALLRHSHRHKPAIIGRPLRFQGATFRFTYTLHSIPCIGFRVEWRGRSMVFTGDHLNDPVGIQKLQDQGVLSRARADDLRSLPLQDTDLLLHETGVPPLHTPLEVLMQLPQRIKRRLYVVHTSALPADCELRVAPTGTAGTIRLDQLQKTTSSMERSFMRKNQGNKELPPISLEDDGLFPSPWNNVGNEYEPVNEESPSADPDHMMSSFAHLSGTSSKTKAARSNSLLGNDSAPPLVSLRPASSTDAWFILNLLSAVPFLSSLSYASTMEVLETARVDAFCKDDVIVPAMRRNQVVCVVWEGTCLEREKSTNRMRGSGRKSVPLLPIREMDSHGRVGAVWHAGDWTGPIALQPERRLSGESPLSSDHDVVAMSSEGVKVITVEFSSLHAILKSGSALYRKYLERRTQQKRVVAKSMVENRHSTATPTQQLLDEAIRNLNVLELLDNNSALRKLSAVQKRHLESLAEGPISFQPGERLWRAGAPVDKAFILVSGTASFVPRRRNAGSVGLPSSSSKIPQHLQQRVNDIPSSSASDDPLSKFSKLSLGESMRVDAITAIRELGTNENEAMVDGLNADEIRRAKGQHIQLDSIFRRSSNEEGGGSSLTDAHDYAKLSRGLQRRADLLSKNDGTPEEVDENPEGVGMNDEDADSLFQFETALLEMEAENGKLPESKDRRMSLARRRSSRARFANKVLGRLYSRRAFTGGLVFSRGHFLGDVSKMVAGLLSSDVESDLQMNFDEEGTSPKYGFGEKTEGGDRGSTSQAESVSELVIHEQEGDELVVHSSTLMAGKDGCIVLVFPKSSLIPFLDEYPGLLLSLLGTQVVV